MKKDSGVQEFQMAGIEEVVDEFGRTQSTIDEEQFKKLVQKRSSMIKDPQIIARTVEGEISEVNPAHYDNPISITRLK